MERLELPIDDIFELNTLIRKDGWEIAGIRNLDNKENIILVLRRIVIN